MGVLKISFIFKTEASSGGNLNNSILRGVTPLNFFPPSSEKPRVENIISGFVKPCLVIKMLYSSLGFRLKEKLPSVVVSTSFSIPELLCRLTIAVLKGFPADTTSPSNLQLNCAETGMYEKIQSNNNVYVNRCFKYKILF